VKRKCNVRSYAFRRQFLLVLSLLVFTTGSPTLAERLSVKIYTSADGLGSSAAFKLVRDSRGFIWLCSRDGLIRFDGNRFITYRIGRDDADPSVFNLLPTRKGTYWIDLNRGTDYRYIAGADSKLLTPAPHSPSTDPRIPLNVEPLFGTRMPAFEDSAGNLWTADEQGVYLMHESGEVQPVELKLPGNPGPTLAHAVFHEGRDKNLWIGTHWGLVRRLPNGKQIHFSLRPEGNADRAILLQEDTRGRIWIVRDDGVLILNPAPVNEAQLHDFTSVKTTFENKSELPVQPDSVRFVSFDEMLIRDGSERTAREYATPVIYSLLCGQDGKLWFATNHGLVVFDGQRFNHYTAEQGLVQSALSAMVEDYDGNIWLASYDGLLRFNPRGLTSFDTTDGLAQTRIHSIYESRDGQLNVVTDNWYLSRLENGAFKTGRPNLPAHLNWFWHSNVAFLDREGDWWIITNEKLFRYSGVSRVEELATLQPTAIYTDKEGLLGNQNYRVFEDSKGNIWISNELTSTPTGITRWERSTGRFQTFVEKDGLPHVASASAFAEDKSGNLWFGFVEGQLARFRDGRFTQLPADQGVPAGMITNLYTDSVGRLWIASSIGGLARIDVPNDEKPVIKAYTIADGLTSNNIRCITEDLFGNIYVGTVRGVNRLTPDTGRIKYYGTSDGLASDFVNVAYRDRSGAIWFGTFSGLSRLIPEADPVSKPPPILISALRVAGVEHSISPFGQAEVFVPDQSANNNNIQIDFFSISTGGAGATHYQYKLEGADSNWSRPTADRTVTFANLSPANYRFLVRAVNADGVSSERAAVVSFAILRPIWQRWWFVLIVSLLLVTLAYAMYRYRVAQLLRVERVRMRIATDLHDDIGSSLSRVAILSEVVKLQTEGAEQAGPLLNEIADSARGLVDSMSDIVWSIDPRRDDLHNIVVRVRQFASDVLENRGIDWDFRVGPEVEKVKIDPERRRHLYLIFKEAINNVVRHAEGVRSVLLSIEIIDGRVVCAVRDDGQGFTVNSAAANGRGGNGLPNMSTRATELRGHLNIDSMPGKGTTVVLTFPLN
jgi:ligand-binding sensor domain-containing protein/signal transduction histidine kinase